MLFVLKLDAIPRQVGTQPGCCKEDLMLINNLQLSPCLELSPCLSEAAFPASLCLQSPLPGPTHILQVMDAGHSISNWFPCLWA
jgi:hypothetical protein